MYVVEGGENGFTSIPTSIYWAVVTVTTVGYGDISPVTPFGKFLSIVVMLCGYSIIAVPTGIVTSEFRQKRALKNDRLASAVEIPKMIQMPAIVKNVVNAYLNNLYFC